MDWKIPSGTPDGCYWAMVIMREHPKEAWKAALERVPADVRSHCAMELRFAWTLAKFRHK